MSPIAPGMMSPIAPLIFCNTFGSFQYFIIADGPPDSISFMISAISGSSLSASIFAFIFSVVAGSCICCIMLAICGSCIICVPSFSAICMKAGFCITFCMASMACFGSMPGGMPGMPMAPAPPGIPGNAPPLAMADCMFSAIALNAGSSAICFAMSLIDGSSSISLIFDMSKGAPFAPGIIMPGGMAPLLRPPGMPKPSGRPPAPAMVIRYVCLLGRCA
mmetsp:Transcript_1578/g.5963  ORF Transcript_1578/g.5963 Transcript_1578/m.5963 type:complete len:219 (-) Transcript_1578:33-689(-)